MDIESEQFVKHDSGAVGRVMDVEKVQIRVATKDGDRGGIFATCAWVFLVECVELGEGMQPEALGRMAAWPHDQVRRVERKA